MPKLLLDIEKSQATLGDLLASQKAVLRDLFVEQSVFDRIISHNSFFPANLSSFWGVEIPLDAASKVDFLLCIHKPEHLLNWSCGLNSDLQQQFQFFSGLKTFSRDWSQQLKNHISNIWFEYDHDQMELGNYTPNFFIGPSKGLHPLHCIAIIQPFLSDLGGNTKANDYKSLLRLIEKLPKGSWLSQIGQMLARRDDSLRVFIQDLPKGSIPDLLLNIGYEGEISTRLLDWLQLANTYCRKVELDLDVASTVGKQLGIELYFEDMESALIFLFELQKRGLCAKEKYNRLYGHLVNLKVDKDALFHRFFSHFKLSFDGETSFKAKAYIGFITKDQMPFAFGTKPLKTKQP